MGAGATRRRSWVLMLVGAVVGTMLVGVGPAGAADEILIVDDPGDAPDEDPGDGFCTTDGGDCTLRAATMEANADPDVDVIDIQLLPGTTIFLTISGNGDGAGSIDITESVTLTTAVPGITVDASGIDASDRVLIVDDGPSNDLIEVTIENLTFTNGQGDDAAGGGGILVGFNDADVTLRGVTIRGNNSEGFGGGLAVLGNVSVTVEGDTLITENEAFGQGGGVYVGDGNLTVVDSAITDNISDDDGGGISATFFDSLRLTNARISGNVADGSGGGLYVDHAPSIDALATPASHAEPVTISGGSISGNTAVGDGGGIFIAILDTMSLTDVDVVSNEAGGDGGGIFVNDEGTLSITRGSVADNTAVSGGGLYVAALDTLTLTDVNVDDNTARFQEGGGIFVGDAGTLTMTRGTVSRNSAEPSGGGLYLGPESITLRVNGTDFVANVARFIEDGGDGGAIYTDGVSSLDIRNATFDRNQAGEPIDDPFFDSEGRGGGIYLGHHVNGNSEPAHATIRTSTFTANIARAGGGAIATERDNTLTVIGSSFVRNRAGVVDPADALLSTGRGGALDLATGTAATLRAAGSTLTRFMDNEAGGPGGAIHAGGSQLTTRDVQFDDNVAGSAGGAVLLTGPDAVTASFIRGRFLRNVASLRGGGVAASSQEATVDLAFTNVLIDSNRADEGGGVHAGDNVDAEISGGVVRRNAATNGAGGGLRALDRLELTNALVEFNTASTSGGGIATSSPLFVTTSTIADNDAMNGGGLVVTAGDAYISRSTFARNDASLSGGGIYILGQGYAAIELSTLTANDANRGAAIRTFGGLDLVRTTITFNTSPPDGASLVVSDGRTTLDHTLIACQQENACIFASGATVVSRGNNMTDDPDCLIPGGDNDRVVLHELIGLNGLQDNGGPTDTHSVRPESLAIDHGATRCPRSPITEGILTVDQRGFPGLVDGDGNGTARCDAGSYEYAQGVLITRSETADEAGPVDGFVELRRSGDLAAPLTVRYEVGGTATPEADYERLSGSVRFPAGSSVVRIRVRPVADDLLEATETVTVALLHSSAYSLGLRTFATVPILDAAGAVTIHATDPIASEVGPDPGTFTIRRTGSLDSALEVFLEFGGSAVQGTDYPLTPTSVVVPGGASSVDLTITPLEDDIADPGETVTATIEDHPDYRVGAPRAAQITIGEATPGLVRYAGEDRKATAVEVSRATWPDGGAAAVVLARADLYPDALAGGPFATLVNAPMLLTDTADLDPIVLAEIERLGVSTVYLLGQTAALSEDVETALLEAGYVVERIGGEDRFETAALIAARVVGNGTLVYITEGLDLDPARGWPDAVSVAPLAAYEGRPILLVTTEEVPEHTFTALSNLGFTQARIIGGPAAVSVDVEEALEGLALEVERYAGEDRYETSRAVVDLELAVGMDPSRLWLATGAKFPDALVAGPAVAAERGVLLLTPQDDLDRAPTTRDFIADLDPSGLLIRLVGGPAAISDVVEQQIRTILGI